MIKITFSQNVDILENRYCQYKQLLINHCNLCCFSTDFSFEGIIHNLGSYSNCLYKFMQRLKKIF